jgi:hypothetical protein
LEQLSDLFNSNFDKIEIEADGYNLSDISEINKLKKDIICDFRIKGKDKDNFYNDMSLDISKKSTYTSIDAQNDTKCLGVQKKIDEIFINRRRILNILNTLWVIVFAPVFFLSLLFVLYYFRNSLPQANYIIYFAIILLIMVVLSYLAPFISIYVYNSIHLKYSWEKQNFYKRNKDRIIVGILCAIVGSGVTLLISLIIKRFSP